MMLKTIRVCAMLLVLVGSAGAGEILTPPAPQTPRTNTAEGFSSNDEDFNETAITTTQIMLTVLVSLLP